MKTVGIRMRFVLPAKFFQGNGRFVRLDETSLVIGLPITTATYNADNSFAVAIGKTAKNKIEQTSYVLCHQPKSFNWRARNAKPHPLGSLNETLFMQVCQRLDQIIQL
ncbi:MAG: type II toxin-antitoxin system PemK/MazF family toxin [Gammaproteobacteria bacterium]|nr:MAG: type II toxin-antitoxin system PemK/MazF family toxin [Gammaproteobacteria bacterium]